MSENNDVELLMKKMHDEYVKTHNVFCPYCGYQLREDTLGEKDMITYQGDHTLQDCPKCEMEFEVQEIVDRTYVSKKIEDVQ